MAWFLVGRVRPAPTVVFDIDGVLVDPSARLERARRLAGGDRRLFWRLFLDPSALVLDRPVPEAVLMARREAVRRQVVLVTGRPRGMVLATLAQMARAGVAFDAAFFRTGFEPAPAYKRRVLEWLSLAGARVVAVHDDSEQVLFEAARVAPSARLVLWRDGRPVLYQPARAREPA